MRITSETMAMRSLDRLQTRLSRYERSQNELASGKRMLKPSDDPAGARRSISLRSAQRAREQDLRNASDATGWLDTADSQLQSASTLVIRVRELATRGASETNPTERQALAAEVRSMRDELVGIANTRHVDRPLFGGFTGGDAVVRGADGAWASNGDGDPITRRLSDGGDNALVRVNVTAAEWLGFGGVESDTLTMLDDLADSLETGTAADVGAKLASLTTATERIGLGLAQIGAATNRVEAARGRAEDLSLSLRRELSEVEDVDLAKGVMDLQMQQVAYEATLQAIGRALPPSLGAFLR